MADRMVTKSIAKTQKIRVKFRAQNVDFFLEIMVWWYHGGTMVPTPYLPPTYPLPTPSLWGGEIVVFSLGNFHILGPEFLYMQKVVF